MQLAKTRRLLSTKRQRIIMPKLPLPASTTSPIVLDTVLLLVLRGGYFLISRRFLVATLSPTLRDISKPELESLDPTAAAPSRVISLNDQDDGIQSTAGPSRIALGHNLSEVEPDSELDSSRPGSPSPSPPILPIHNKPESMELGSLKGGKRAKKVVVLNHGGRSDQGRTARKTARGLGSIARILFCLCFAESCILLTLVMFHSVGILQSRSRHVHFSFSLHTLLSLVLLIIPLVQCMFLTYRSRESSTSPTSRRKGLNLTLSKRLLLSLLPFAIYIFLFTRIPPYITTVAPVLSPEEAGDYDSSQHEGWEGGGWLEPSLGRVVVLGVVVMGALSGLGAVRTAWMFLEGGDITGGRKLTDGDILQAERSLYRVRHDLVAKREEINNVTAARGSAPSSLNWMGRVFGGNDELAPLESELRGLQAMESQVSRSVEAMKARRQRQSFGNSWRGKGYNAIGYFFAAYCIARVLMCFTSLLFAPLSTSQVATDNDSGPKPKGNTNGDWISFLIALGLSQLPNNSVDVALWARGISLLLTGLLILSSLAQVLRSVSRILRLTSKSVGIGFLLLSLGQLMSTYVISLLIQLRTTLPQTPVLPDSPFDNSNGTLSDFPQDASPLGAFKEDPSLLATLPDFRIFGRLFDVMFLLAAASTLLYRYIAKKVNGAEELGEIYH